MDDVIAAILLTILCGIVFALGLSIGESMNDASNRTEGYCAALHLTPANIEGKWVCLDPSKFAEIKP